MDPRRRKTMIIKTNDGDSGTVSENNGKENSGNAL